uniref:NADH dehydrogenase subunit 2 n=1 Tax=Desmometopa sabroskyi TaxID=3118444 RepID=UPI003000FAD1
MFNNSAKLMFLFILMFGSIITISSNSWLGAWMGLEINLLAFIPLMSDNNTNSSEAALKYFLTQALASAVLLFTIILMMFNLKTYLLNNNSFIQMMMLSCFLLKMGAAPFHFWFPNIMEGMSWINSFILMTWQKIAPFMLTSYIINNYLIIICAILSTMMGALGGLNQTLLRKLMAYSSINHLGWMLSSLMLNEMLWMTYFLFYSFLSFNLILFFNLFKIFHIKQMFSLFFNSKILKFVTFMNLLSLGGLPPFLGFIPKWLVINSLTMNNHLFLNFMLIAFTLITLFFYLRICYSGFMMNYYEPHWQYQMNTQKYLMNLFLITSSISILGLMFISLFYMMF